MLRSINRNIKSYLTKIYKDILINQNVPWVQINGDYAERLQTAIETINETFAIH